MYSAEQRYTIAAINEGNIFMLYYEDNVVVGMVMEV